jgi:hypothetical protein
MENACKGREKKTLRLERDFAQFHMSAGFFPFSIQYTRPVPTTRSTIIVIAP